MGLLVIAVRPDRPGIAIGRCHDVTVLTWVRYPGMWKFIVRGAPLTAHAKSARCLGDAV
jgi:hypothetical protein